MSNEIRKIFILILTVFIITCAFIPALNPMPTVNNSLSTTPLYQLYTDIINSSHSSSIENWFDNIIDSFRYSDDFSVPLYILVYVAIGVLLVLFFIGVIILIVSRKSGGFLYLRVIAILNTVTYAILIVLTFYQSNKLSNNLGGWSDGFKITPSLGAWIGFFTSFVLIFITKRERERLQADDRNYYNTQYMQNPPFPNKQVQEVMYTQPHVDPQIPSAHHIQEQVLCQSCGQTFDKGTLFCSKCGKSLCANTIFCHKCGSKVKEGSTFCQACGERVINNTNES